MKKERKKERKKKRKKERKYGIIFLRSETKKNG